MTSDPLSPGLNAKKVYPSVFGLHSAIRPRKRAALTLSFHGTAALVCRTLPSISRDTVLFALQSGERIPPRPSCTQRDQTGTGMAWAVPTCCTPCRNGTRSSPGVGLDGTSVPQTIISTSGTVRLRRRALRSRQGTSMIRDLWNVPPMSACSKCLELAARDAPRLEGGEEPLNELCGTLSMALHTTVALGAWSAPAEPKSCRPRARHRG
eukprot:scaffold58451_cov70-Phaeocystis_antarctica.AAC.3